MGTLRRWTADDVIKLKGMVQKYPIARIAADLGRTQVAIIAKAYQLGLSLRRTRLGERLGKSGVDPGAAGMDLV
jgi:hypothetical protein